MIDKLNLLLTHPIYGVLIIVPVVGVFWSRLLMPVAKDKENSPIVSESVTVNNVVNVYNNVVVYGGNGGRRGADPAAIILLFSALFVAIVYSLLNYGQMALRIVQFSALSVMGMGLVGAIRGYASGRFVGSSWLFRFLWPFVASFSVFWVLLSVDGKISELIMFWGARSISEVIRSISNPYFVIALEQGLALMLSAIVVVIGFLYSSYYLLLADFSNASDQRRWRAWFLRLTYGVSGAVGPICLLVLCVAASFFAFGRDFGVHGLFG